MPPQGRLGDKSNVPLCNHGCPACPHPCIGPGVEGSPNVKVNGRPALRMDDPGIHGGCCMRNDWNAIAGSGTVFINGKPAHRLGDDSMHCGGPGALSEGSSNVVTGGPMLTNIMKSKSETKSSALKSEPPAEPPAEPLAAEAPPTADLGSVNPSSMPSVPSEISSAMRPPEILSNISKSISEVKPGLINNLKP